MFSNIFRFQPSAFTGNSTCVIMCFFRMSVNFRSGVLVLLILLLVFLYRSTVVVLFAAVAASHRCHDSTATVRTVVMITCITFNASVLCYKLCDHLKWKLAPILNMCS